ncbi:cytochrome c oxidase subunit 3 [Gimesia chilikensis]|uniref:Cytochrome c oxidase subunit 3 n=1 Tax=Gimesia chilikensis TaxID=2605989 RepID=A0A517PXP8_9PLAN|nr:cytochrome c oxidase subunit 3 [Gimesia chilikensis]QDT24153.1 Cytochrome c oxidase subunit 3 [Gimesia chilikensis]
MNTAATTTTDEHSDAHDHEHHDPRLAHHFDSHQQQFDTGKLGIWLFLVTEVLFFSGLFGFYAVYRSLHPEVFVYASQFLDTTLGAANTIVLLFSSLTMAWGVRCAQLGQTRGLLTCLVITLGCAAIFLGVKSFEYTEKAHHGLLWAGAYVSPEHHGEEHVDPEKAPGAAAAAALEAEAIEAEKEEAHAEESHNEGDTLFEKTKATLSYMTLVLWVVIVLSGVAFGALIKNSNKKNLATIAGCFLVSAIGMQIGAYASIGYHAFGHHEEPTKQEIQMAETAPIEYAEQTEKVPEPKLAGTFFSVYFCMTGLHAIHIIGGMIAISWLIVRTVNGAFTTYYFGAVDFVGLYWHLVDLIWIYLFPLLYLIN